MTTTPRPPAARPLRTRRVRFSYPTGARRQHFVKDELVLSHLVAVLSALFPEGEDFFVRSVRAYRDKVTDPELAEQVKGFIGQEVTHGREHRELNRRLAEMGYPTDRVDRHVRQLLAVVDRTLPRQMSLAATAALEHYTATFAEILLTDERAQDLVGTSQVSPMLLWHALEESEHKAVAFDVYRAAGGSEVIRVLTMEIASLIFWTELAVQTVRSLAGDPAAYHPVRLLRSLNNLRRMPFFSLSAIRRYRSYNRLGFHPDDWDATQVIEHWNRRLFGDGGAHGMLADKAG